jgi:diguanylate cyclase (GGDEF)-like protein
MVPAPARRRSHIAGVLVLAAAWLGVMGGLAGFLSSSQARAHRAVTQRLEGRAQTGAEFAALYVQNIFTREQAQARRWLASPNPTMEDLRNASNAMGVRAAVLLDRSGQLLQVLPAKPALLGQVMTGKYPHLAAAVAGRTAVSNVVPSAARGLPVVGFATPFDSSSGRRVFSGAFEVAKTPLGAYMSHLVAIPGRRVYLIDADDKLIAASNGFRSGGTLLEANPELADHARSHSAGSYSVAHGSRWFVTATIAGTPWRIVISVPAAALFVSVDGADQSLAWIALIGLAIAGLIIIAIGSGLARSRHRLATLNDELDGLAHVDSLTGLPNRRDIEERLTAVMSFARRHGADLAVLLIDIDHFKHVNDTLGHQAGDRVLISAAHTIQRSLRTEDTVGRWGGEEFLVVLPDTNAGSAAIVAERIRAEIADRKSHSDLQQPITVTIGVAAWTSGDMDDLIKRADAALYVGKTNGRNVVELLTHGPQTPV